MSSLEEAIKKLDDSLLERCAGHPDCLVPHKEFEVIIAALHLERREIKLRERLAALCHEQWSGWMKYLFERSIPLRNDVPEDATGVIITHSYAARWHRQMNTPYGELSEVEKESDRKEADKFLALLTEGPK